jgi:hypothetical protein
LAGHGSHSLPQNPLSHTHGHDGEVEDAKIAFAGLATTHTVQARFCVAVHGVFWNEPIWHAKHGMQEGRPDSLA